MKSEVEKAVAAICKHYSPMTVEVFESSCGGAYVLIHDVPLGHRISRNRHGWGFS